LTGASKRTSNVILRLYTGKGRDQNMHFSLFFLQRIWSQVLSPDISNLLTRSSFRSKCKKRKE